MFQAPIQWESVDVTPQLKDGKTVIPDKAIDSVKTNYVALKGPLAVRPDLTCTVKHWAYTSTDTYRQRPCLPQSHPPSHV